MPKKMKKDGEPKVHEDLSGFDITIDKFGQMQSNFDVDKLNNFLNENVQDKKLVKKSLSDQEE